MTSTLILEYVKVVLSWPVILGIGGMIGLINFKTEVRGLVNRIGSVKVAGFEFGTSQQEKSKDEPEAEAQPVAVNEPVPAVVADAQVSTEERINLEAAFVAERAAARMWEYRYLNYYFAPSTQNVLDWFINIGVQTTFNTFETAYINILPSKVEREAVITALQKHSCIIVQSQTITVSDKGREYAAWNERRVLLVAITVLK